MKKLSHILSAVFSPLLVPPYGMILVSYLTIMAIVPRGFLWLAIGVVFLITCIIPVTGILALYKTGVIKDAALKDRKSTRRHIS